MNSKKDADIQNKTIDVIHKSRR